MLIHGSSLLLFASGLVSGAAINGRNNGGGGNNPVVDLGNAGKYRGILQNNGTVESWKGIPYAEPPVGNLRFKAPQALGTQGDDVVDVSDDALRCIQFTNPPFTGVKAGPGVEDCLKLWIWKPVGAKKGDNLPVHFYIHGGGLQYSAAANNDFSDWVGQQKNIIAVNVAYRLGALGFMASEDLQEEGQHANAGLLDQRLALKWVRQNIAEFGGDPYSVTLAGQSGGGFAVVGQLALYDGNNGNLFQKAMPRSVQRSTSLTIPQLKERNTAFAAALNCTSNENHLDCFRKVSPYDLVQANRVISRQNGTDGLSYAGFLPTVDGYTLTDTVTRLIKQGKIAKVPTIAGAVNDEGSFGGIRQIDQLTPALGSSLWNLTNDQLEEVISYYAVNETFGYASPDNFFLTNFKAYIQGLNTFGEPGITGSERLVGRYMSDKIGGNKVWTYRFNSPTVGITHGLDTPLAYVPHSSDNSYLQNATAVMTDVEKKLAYEFRSYVASFVRTGDPNKEKLASAPNWPCYGALGDYVNQPIRMVPTFAFDSNANKSAPTSTQAEVVQRAQLEREAFWTSDRILDSIRY